MERLSYHLVQLVVFIIVMSESPSQPIRVILVDDERIGRTRLRMMLEREPDIQILAECSDGPAAVEAIREHNPDLVFLDINMPGMDGFGVLDRLAPERQPIVIFVTAYDDHAVRAFEACALDYLLKPVAPERLARTLARVRKRLATEAAARPAAADAVAPSDLPRFVVRSRGRVSFVAAEDIDWVEAAGNYAIFHVGKLNHMVRETMTSLEGKLPAQTFMRVSRSAIVNLHRVKELVTSPTSGDAAVLEGGQHIPVTRNPREIAERLATV